MVSKTHYLVKEEGVEMRTGVTIIYLTLPVTLNNVNSPVLMSHSRLHYQVRSRDGEKNLTVYSKGSK